jgi:hypothetical protein
MKRKDWINPVIPMRFTEPLPLSYIVLGLILSMEPTTDVILGIRPVRGARLSIPRG